MSLIVAPVGSAIRVQRLVRWTVIAFFPIEAIAIRALKDLNPNWPIAIHNRVFRYVELGARSVTCRLRPDHHRCDMLPLGHLLLAAARLGALLHEQTKSYSGTDFEFIFWGLAG